MSADRTPMLVACRKCEHVWLLVWTPCAVDVFVKFKRPRCPSCGADGKSVVVASRKAGHLTRYVELLEAELPRAKTEASDVQGPTSAHRAPAPEGHGA